MSTPPPSQRTSGEPRRSPDHDERAALEHFLAVNRAAAVAVVEGLSDRDAARVVLPSGWSPLDLVIHLAGVERHWFLLALGGDRSDEPAFAAPVETLQDAVAAYRAEWFRSDALLAGLTLDDPLAVPVEQLVEEVSTVRGVSLHVIEEVARHAGHLDVARELFDGRTGLGQR